MFHVSNLKKCYYDDPLVVPLEGLQVDDKLHFVEQPVEIMDREVKQLRRSRVLIVKVRWNSRRGPEFTWEREDQFRKKYPHLFTKTTPSSKVKGWLDKDLEYYHLKELHYSVQCHTQMSLWIISRGVVLLILLMEYKFQVWYIELTSPSDHNTTGSGLLYIVKGGLKKMSHM
ncbi:hypothetical protein Tco_0738810 [Tanacetum coccineum]